VLTSNGHRSYDLIDADTHVNEPPDLWRDRVPAKFKDRAPRHESFDEGDAWVLDGVADPINYGLNSCAGMDPEMVQGWIRWEDVRPGGYDPKARVAEMDQDRVDAQLLFPTPRLSFSMFAQQDPEFHEVLIRAYNDWLAEYCAYAPDRFGGLALLTNRGVEGAISEFQRTIEQPGIVGAIMGCYPHGDLNLTDEDDALFKTLAAAQVPLTIHVSLVDQMPTSAKNVKFAGDVRFYDAPKRILQLLWSGVFDRVPDLQVLLVEVDAGWVPYFMEQVDDRYMRMGRGNRTQIDRMPSEYIKQHFSFAYVTDHVAIRNRHDIGVENLLWSSDYPHVGSDWPNSWRTIAADFSGVPDNERHLILAGNVQRLFRIGE